MTDLNKNVLTDEQKQAKEIIDKFFKELDDIYTSKRSIDPDDLKWVKKKLKREYALIPLYDTLREYLGEHANGAYHKFIFSISGREMQCIGPWDFGNYYNDKLLDEYVVIDDLQKNNGVDCTNYECVHKLTLKRKGEIE